MKSNKALLIVDMQKDFCPGGKLPVRHCDKVVENLNKYIKKFQNANLPIFASRDWHPEETVHFKKFGGIWPQHCIKNTKGAEFHPGLKLPEEAIIISKGMEPGKDSYSSFYAYNEEGKSFKVLLDEMEVETLYIGGVATDYCVKFSCLDALKNGFSVKLLINAIEGVDINPGDIDKAIKEMEQAGVEKITLEDLDLNLHE